MEEPQPSGLTEEDLKQKLVIFIAVDGYGDVGFSTNSANLDYPTAIGLVEMARAKMVAEAFGQAHARRQEEERKKPQIIVPEMNIAPGKKRAR